MNIVRLIIGSICGRAVTEGHEIDTSDTLMSAERTSEGAVDQARDDPFNGIITSTRVPTALP